MNKGDAPTVDEKIHGRCIFIRLSNKKFFDFLKMLRIRNKKGDWK